MTRHGNAPSSEDLSDEQKRHLLRKIADSLKGSVDQGRLVLDFLLQEHLAGRRPKGEEIRQIMTAKGTPPREANAVIPVITRLKAHLKEYFAKYHDDEPVRVRIVSSPYGLVFERNVVPFGERELVKEFWKPHISETGPVSIIYTEPLFTRDKDFNEFVRRVELNTEPTDPVVDRYFCYSHVPLGEAVATMMVMKAMKKFGKETIEFGCRKGIAYEDIIKHSPSPSFVVFGAPRANGFLYTIQRDARLHIEASTKAIRIDGEDTYKETQNDSSVVGYVIITRVRRMGRLMTLFHGNHGAAIAKLVDVHLDNNSLRNLYQNEIPELVDAYLPEQFQLLFEVEIDIRGERVAEEIFLRRTWPEPLVPKSSEGDDADVAHDASADTGE